MSVCMYYITHTYPNTNLELICRPDSRSNYFRFGGIVQVYGICTGIRLRLLTYTNTDLFYDYSTYNSDIQSDTEEGGMDGMGE